MKNFKVLRKDVDTEFILEELYDALNHGYIKNDRWLSTQDQTERKLTVPVKNDQHPPSAHINSSWQQLISAFPFSRKDYQKRSNDNSSFLYKNSLYIHFPNTISFLENFANESESYLQRVTFAILPPGGEVLPHIDEGSYYKIRNRFHLVIQSTSGSEFYSGLEMEIFKQGELWWFNNKKIHKVRNLGEDLRIHIIFDLLPKKYVKLSHLVYYRIWNIIFQALLSFLGKLDFTNFIENNKSAQRIIFS